MHFKNASKSQNLSFLRGQLNHNGFLERIFFSQIYDFENIFNSKSEL